MRAVKKHKFYDHKCVFFTAKFWTKNNSEKC